MKADTHPPYYQVEVTCVCGHVIKTGTTTQTLKSIDICEACHPFYTGTQKIVDTEGRIEKFKRRYDNVASKTKESGKKQKKQAEKAEGLQALKAVDTQTEAPSEDAPEQV